MAIAFDAMTADTGSGGWAASPRNISHTPVGTPKGIVCLITTLDASDVVSGVTYGGTAMTRVAAATVISTTAGEVGSVYVYFLGASVPTGTQTCAITNTAAVGGAVVISLTATANTEVDTGNTLDQASGANPSVSLSTTAATDTFICGALVSGQNAVGSVTPNASYTEMAEDDFGSQVVSFLRRTSNGAGGAISISWTAASEDAIVGAVAIKESAAVTYTATAALTIGNLELAASMEGPLYSATANLLLGNLESAATMEFDPPVFSATAALLLGNLEMSGGAEGPLFSASADLVLGGLEFAGVGQRQCTCAVTMPLAGLQASANMAGGATFTASADLAFGGLRAVANMEGPLFAITAPLTLGNLEAAAEMTFTDADNYASVAAATLGNLELAAVMEFTAPGYVVTAALALPGFTGKAFMTASCHVEVASVAARARHRYRRATVSHARRFSRASHQKDTC